jgi:hypothetical protein
MFLPDMYIGCLSFRYRTIDTSVTDGYPHSNVLLALMAAIIARLQQIFTEVYKAVKIPRDSQ